jgi:ubiquinone/menaquinone biosynthesis C-methylase UbiE
MLRRLNFSLWYFFRPPWDSGISPPELLDFISHHPAGRAIDLGCGTGTNALTLVQRGWQVTGVDFAPRAIQLARRKLARAGYQASLSLGDVTKLQGISGPFDLALDLGCFHGIPARSAYLAQLVRVVRPGGNWLLYAMLKQSAADSRPGITEADLQLIQASGFEILSRNDGWNRRNRPSAWFLFEHR